jgi:hypothetical protein
MAKNMIDDYFKHANIACRVSVVAMGRDGDLKPSPRNRRGRYVSAQQTMPVKDYEKSIGRPIEDLLTYIELDRQGVLEEIGWPAYTGMGGEIIPAFYRTMKNNPRPDLVSSLQKLYVKTCGDDLFFGVELPNVEVGITSSPEGIISPMAREAPRRWRQLHWPGNSTLPHYTSRKRCIPEDKYCQHAHEDSPFLFF